MYFSFSMINLLLADDYLPKNVSTNVYPLIIIYYVHNKVVPIIHNRIPSMVYFGGTVSSLLAMAWRMHTNPS